jgi:hypothetical protein
MATITVVETNAPYYRVRVAFGAQVFEQQVVSPLTGSALDAMLQDYADEYEAAWLALPPVEPPVEE